MKTFMTHLSSGIAGAMRVQDQQVDRSTVTVGPTIELR